MRQIINLIAWLGIPLGVILVLARVPWLGIALGLLGLLVDIWYLRPNRSRVVKELQIASWPAVADGEHNSNTDLMFWRDAFYLVHAASPFHFASQKCRLIVRRSTDGQTWEKLAEISLPGEDIRDPKFAVIEEKVFLYALANRSLDPEPYTTVYTTSDDCVHWEAPQPLQPEGWLFWRPKSLDGHEWYAPAYWWEHGKSILLRSTDGIRWEILSTIYEGGRNDETDIEFLSDGRLLATARLEYSSSIFGNRRGCTLIATASPSYTSWQIGAQDDTTRLDGPCLFAWNGRVYAAGRYQPVIGGPTAWPGSVFSRKRTSLFEVKEQGLVYLSDLPSAGDTSYTGVVVKEGMAFISYYTSDIRRDYPWLLGMIQPTNIQMAKVDLGLLEKLADSLRHAVDPDR